MTADVMRLPLPEPDDSHPLDWYPEDSEAIGLPGVLTETSYTLPPDLNLGQWLAIGETLQRMERSVMWWLGDWWRYGERRYDQEIYQSVPEMVKDVTGHAYQTVRAAGWVAGKFEPERRLEDVPWTFHREVAVLPPVDADSLLTECIPGDTTPRTLTRKQLVERVKERQGMIAVEAAKAVPMPAPAIIPPTVRAEVADVSKRMPLDDSSVHLIVTSPPYGVGIDEYQDGGDILAGDWPEFMLSWLSESLRVACEHGRLALNVPLDTTRGGFRPTYAQAVQMAEAAGWEYRSSIIWVDDQLGKSTARGSMDSAAAPHVIAGAEMVALFSKGEWRRDPVGSMVSGDPRWLQHDEWLEWANGIWRFPGETRAFGGHPAPFPYELPRRLIKYLSFPGDVVLDPFSGSGTTALAAHRLGRDFVGFDRSPEYVKLTLRRVVEAA